MRIVVALSLSYLTISYPSAYRMPKEGKMRQNTEVSSLLYGTNIQETKVTVALALALARSPLH
jgi:hypothetical protein